MVFWVEEFWGNVGKAFRAGYFRQGFVWVVLVTVGVVVTGVEPVVCTGNPSATVILPMQAAENVAVSNDSVGVKSAPPHVQVDHSIVRNVDDVRFSLSSSSWYHHCRRWPTPKICIGRVLWEPFLLGTIRANRSAFLIGNRVQRSRTSRVVDLDFDGHIPLSDLCSREYSLGIHPRPERLLGADEAFFGGSGQLISGGGLSEGLVGDGLVIGHLLISGHNHIVSRASLISSGLDNLVCLHGSVMCTSIHYPYLYTSGPGIENRSEGHEKTTDDQTFISNRGFLPPFKNVHLCLLGIIRGLVSAAFLCSTVILFNGPFLRSLTYCAGSGLILVASVIIFFRGLLAAQ